MRINRSKSYAIIIWIAVLFAFWPSVGYSQDDVPASGQSSENVRELLTLLNQSDVQQWLKTQLTSPDASKTVNAAPVSLVDLVSARLVRIRERAKLVSEGAMDFGQSLNAARSKVAEDVRAMGAFQAILQFAALPVFALIGSMALGRWVAPLPSAGKLPPGQTQLPSFAKTIGFIIGGALPLLLFPWAELFKQAALVVVLAMIGIRLAVFLGRFCIQALSRSEPSGDDGDKGGTRIGRVADEDAQARHWYVSIVGLVCYFLAGWALVELAGLFGFSNAAELLLVYVLASGLYVIALRSVWKCPEERLGVPIHKTLRSWLWSIAITVLLLFWFSGLHGMLWIGVFAITLPFVLPFSSQVTRALLEQPGSEAGRASVALTILLDRGVRAIIVALSALWLARVLGLEATSMASGETTVDRIARGILQGIVIVLVADLFWAFAKAQIEARLTSTAEDAQRTDEERSRASRLRTLLPIFRNVLAAVIGIVAILMVLSGLGIEIAPLLAGAGVVGVAVGFGAQTIVKDVISGMFYLWDDAFRIGEYIETGKYKGTVESFSLRSVKLRHHRGPLTTVPFGDLGAVQNMSRDWSVTKFNLRVAYDTDLDKLRKVIKKVGQELAERPEYKDNVISPLKMKGVVEFGEYAIEVRVGFTTKPGEQFMIRRDAMTSIRLAFKDNGIHFALPTVQVSNSESGDDNDAAVAQMLRAREQKKAEAAAAPAE